MASKDDMMTQLDRTRRDDVEDTLGELGKVLIHAAGALRTSRLDVLGVCLERIDALTSQARKQLQPATPWPPLPPVS